MPLASKPAVPVPPSRKLEDPDVVTERGILQTLRQLNAERRQQQQEKPAQ